VHFEAGFDRIRLGDPHRRKSYDREAHAAYFGRRPRPSVKIRDGDLPFIEAHAERVREHVLPAQFNQPNASVGVSEFAKTVPADWVRLRLRISELRYSAARSADLIQIKSSHRQLTNRAGCYRHYGLETA
jgi:hypothetical protein